MARKSRKNTDANNAPGATSVNSPLFRAGAYVRLSVEDRRVKGDSIETQQAIIKAFVEEHSDIELAEVYIDNGLSGQIFERPAFNRMIEDMESGKINCCISKDLSRLGRNAIDAGYYIEKYFPTKGIRYIAITDDYDSADPKSGGIMVNLKNMVNEHYALEIGRKIRQTKQMNISKGKFVGRLAPYGFKKSEADKYVLVHDPYAAPIVHRMFEMAAEGLGVTAILNWLNGEGILPPKRYYHSIGIATDNDVEGRQTQWNKGVIYNLLKNRVYCGDMVQGKFKCHSYVQTTVPKSEWITVEDTHEGIVSREFFESVQEIWTSGKTRSGNSRMSENIFLRKAYCGHCGLTLKRRSNSKSKEKYSLACNTRQVYSKDSCVPVSINEDTLKGLLLDMLCKQAEVLGIDNVIASQSHPSGWQAADKAEIHRLQTEIANNSRFLKSLYESLVTHDITREEYRELKAGYEAKIAALSEKERELRDNMVERMAEESKKAKAAANLRGVIQVDDLNADKIDKLIEKILVFEDTRIEVYFKFNDGIAVIGGGCGEHDKHIEQAG